MNESCSKLEILETGLEFRVMQSCHIISFNLFILCTSILPSLFLLHLYLNKVQNTYICCNSMRNKCMFVLVLLEKVCIWNRKSSVAIVSKLSRYSHHIIYACLPYFTNNRQYTDLHSIYCLIRKFCITAVSFQLIYNQASISSNDAFS